MKKYISSSYLVFLIIPGGAPVANTTDASYTANRGDCLSGIASAHYPDATSHHFVLKANPEIEDADQIAVGQKVRLPGLDPSAVRLTIDQTGCNASVNRRAHHSPLPSPAPAMDPSTTPGPIDRSLRTVAVTPQGTPTQVTSPTALRPVVAAARSSRGPVLANRIAASERYVVNAIGARTRAAALALVQLSDRQFYVVGRERWATKDDADVITVEVPPSVNLAEPDVSRTERAGNLFVDQSLLLKMAADAGAKR